MLRSVIASALLIFAGTANSAVRYTYQGQPFTSFQGDLSWLAGTPTAITGFVLLDQPVPNCNDYCVYSFRVGDTPVPAALIDFSFSDGITTYTLADVRVRPWFIFNMDLIANSVGDIEYWAFQIWPTLEGVLFLNYKFGEGNLSPVLGGPPDLLEGIPNHGGISIYCSPVIGFFDCYDRNSKARSQGPGSWSTTVVPIPPAAVNDGPIAVTEGIATVIPVGANDTGFANPVTVTVTAQPTKGTISSISGPGPAAGMTITYTANVGAVGADSFGYEMTDSSPAADFATVTLNISQDSDGDGVVDQSDNCTLVANALVGNVPSTTIPKYQLDSDGDGYGNACDADLNNSGTVTTADYGLLRSVLGELASWNALTAAADMNGSGTVTTSDFGLLRARLGTAPGPSGLHP